MELSDIKVLTIVSNDFDDLEFYYPLIRLKEAGADVIVAGPEAETVYKGKNGLSVLTDNSFDEIDIKDFDGILIPGGWAPDYLRRFETVLDFVRYLDAHKRVVGVICHAGWVLASAGIINDVEMTSTPGIKDDLINAGATWVDKPVVVDGNIISARRPPDLPYYLPKLIEAFKNL